MKRNTVCKLAEVLGWLELIFGSIGSLMIACAVGDEYYEVWIGIFVFVICIFNVLVMTVVLFGIKNILSENKDISKKNVGIQQPGDI